MTDDDLERLLRQRPPGVPESIRPLDPGGPDPVRGNASRVAAVSDPLVVGIVALLMVGAMASLVIWRTSEAPSGGGSPPAGSPSVPSSPAASAQKPSASTLSTASLAPSEPAPSTVTPSPSASPATFDVIVPLAPGHQVSVTVVDESGTLKDARPAGGEELEAPDMVSANADIFVRSVGSDGLDLAVVWIGVICDRTATMTIAADVTAIMVQAGPRSTCDAMAVPRGVVLTFDRAIDPIGIEVSLSHE